MLHSVLYRVSEAQFDICAHSLPKVQFPPTPRMWSENSA
jgi:hypothetical protein